MPWTLGLPSTLVFVAGACILACRLSLWPSEEASQEESPLRSLSRSDAWWGIAERPGDIHEASWGETPIPKHFEDAEKNPWIEAAKMWSGTGARKRQKMVILGGLPHSGTTLLEAFLMQYSEISTLQFANSSDTMEGMNMPGMGDALPFPYWGGSKGDYGQMCGLDRDRNFRPGIHLTGEEGQHLIQHFRRRSFESWRSFNYSKPILAEKDPPNLLRMGFHKKVFGETHDLFPIFTMKHPLEIGSSFHCDPSSKTRFRVTENWLNCQRAWVKDLELLDNYLVIPYEAWFLDFEATARAIERYLNLQPAKKSRRLNLWNPRAGFALKSKAFGTCQRTSKKIWKSQPHPHVAAFSAAVAVFGYDLMDSTSFEAPESFPLCKLGGRPCAAWA